MTLAQLQEELGWKSDVDFDWVDSKNAQGEPTKWASGWIPGTDTMLNIPEELYLALGNGEEPNLSFSQEIRTSKTGNEYLKVVILPKKAGTAGKLGRRA